MALTLKLNRGASYTTINLNDVTNYRVLDTWNPRIATRKVSQFGGEPYKDVIESIPLYVKGTTAAVVLEKIEDILAAMEQAFAWKLGAIVDPVLLEYLPTGSSLGAVVQADVLGTPADAADMLELAQLAMYMTGNSFETIITLPLWRKGRWLGAAETPAASSAVSNPGKMSVTFATSKRIPSPVKVVFNDESTPGVGGIPEHRGYVFWADQADKIQILDSNVMSPFQGLGIWTSEVITNALGGTVRKIDTSSNPTGIGGDVSAMNASARLFMVFASIRNLSTTQSWTAKALLYGGTYTEGRPVVIEPGTGTSPNVYPRLENMGIIATYGELSDAYILVESASTTDDIEIDYILVIAKDEFTGAVVWSDETQGVYAYSQELDAFTVDPRSLTSPRPDIYHDTGKPFAWHKGDLMINNVGTNLTTVLTGSSIISQNWRLETSGAVVMSFSMTATRYPAYLVVR